MDELNAFLGAARATVSPGEPAMAPLAAILLRVEHELFNLGSILATLPEDVHPRQARITDAEVAQLETEMDRMNADLPPLAIVRAAGRQPAQRRIAHLPDGMPARRAAVVALAREEPVPPEAVRYLNRLSDALFVWSRWASHRVGVPETLWEPNRAASGVTLSE